MTYYSKFADNPMRTRSDFQKAVRDLFEPMVAYIDRQGARIDFHDGGAHYDMRSSSTEGIARPLWGIVPLTLGGGDFGHWPLLRRAIAEGTDPEHPHFWGDAGDYCQRSVEMAAFGVMLLLSPQEGWAPFSEREKANLLKWLERIQHVKLVDNNWLFFAVLVQEGLRRIGHGDLVDENLQRTYLDKLSSWYLGGGWYGDGPGLPVDHYGAFAMHFYALIYAHFGRQPDPDLSKAFVARANAFLEPFSYWFADSGETLMAGRSLTYRFATAAFWGMAGVAGLDGGMSMGQIKGLWARQIRSWRNKPIFTADGLLSRGYYYPNLIMCEEYNSPTSPYWAMKAFFPLALSADSAFWQAEEEPLTCKKTIYAMPEASMVAQRAGGHSIVHYAGPVRPDFQPDKYNKFAYSTNFGADFNSLQYAEQFRFGDNILAFSYDNGANWQMMTQRTSASVDGSTISCVWRSGHQDVTTTIDVQENGVCTRTHTFELDRPALVVDTGFAVDQWYEDVVVMVPDAQTLAASGKPDACAVGIEPTAGAMVAVKGTNGVSGVRSLDGYAKRFGVGKRTHTNVATPRTAVPFVLVDLPAGRHRLVDRFAASPSARAEIFTFLMQ